MCIKKVMYLFRYYSIKIYISLFFFFIKKMTREYGAIKFILNDG